LPDLGTASFIFHCNYGMIALILTPGANMFVILLQYKKPLSEVDRFVPEHREFLAEQYAAGVFKMSGRMEPRTGGVILARAGSRAELETIIQRDPFHREQIADYEIVEFCPTMSSADLAHLTET
jgi:uncharacterized protein YciI